MTKTDREYVDLTAELAAQKAVKEMVGELHCRENSQNIATALEQIANNQDHIGNNKKDIRANKKFLFFGIGILFLSVIAAFITYLLTGGVII